MKILKQPSHGKAEVSSNGKFINYMPNEGFRDDLDTFSYILGKTGCPDSIATVSVLVQRAATCPQANNDTATTSCGSAITIDVLKNDLYTAGASITIGKPPSHGTAKVAGQSILYTPNSGFRDDLDTFSYKLAKPCCPDSTATVSVLVQTPQTCPQANSDIATTSCGSAITIDVLKNDLNAVGASIIIGKLPSHGTAKVAGQSILYTPNPGFRDGLDTFSYRLTKSCCPDSTATVNVLVQTPAACPQANNDTAMAPSIISPITIDILKNDLYTSGASIKIIKPPSVGKAEIISDSNGKFIKYYTSRELDGFDSFTYILNKSCCPDSSAAVIVGMDPYFRLYPRDDSATALCGEAITLDVLKNDEYALSEPAIKEVGTPQHGSAVLNKDGKSITYTPSKGFCGGTDIFTYTISNPSFPDAMAYVKVNVIAPASCPKANDDSFTAYRWPNLDVSHVYSIDVLANDKYPVGTTIKVNPGPNKPGFNNGIIYVSPGGKSIIYAPADVNLPYKESFSYTLSKPGCRDSTATVNVLVQDAKDDPRPVAPYKTLITSCGKSITFNPSTSASLYLVPGKLPSHGVCTVNTDGSITYTPNPGFRNGEDTFFYTLSKQGNLNSTAAVKVFVATPESCPQAKDKTLITSCGKPVTITPLAMDPFATPSNLKIGKPALHGTALVSNIDASITYTPNPGFRDGQDTFTYIISKSCCPDSAATAKVSISCSCPPGTTGCNGTCIDTLSDQKNCGTCGNACADGMVCSNGSCICPSEINKESCPLANDDKVKTYWFTTTYIDVLANDKNAEGASIIVGKPLYGRIHPNPKNRSILYLAAIGSMFDYNLHHGIDSFTYTLSKPCCPDSTATVRAEFCDPTTDPNCRIGNCGGAYVYLQNDTKNCGTCGNACTDGKVCNNGRCVCPAGMTDCSGTCINLQGDFKNCGLCGRSCNDNNYCTKDFCSGGVCYNTKLSDSNSCCDGKPVDIKNDSKNCGKCGTVCPNGTSCVQGKCGMVCPIGKKNCGGTCIDTSSDPANCGLCGKNCDDKDSCTIDYCSSGACKHDPVKCNSGKVCNPANGRCADCVSAIQCSDSNACTTDVCLADHTCGHESVPDSSTCCSGKPVNTQTDSINCGACNIICADGSKCCSGRCVNTASDPNNCGDCGTICNGNKVCSNGLCVCPAGQVECGGTCVNIQNDRNNCGTCGKVCPGGGDCISGTCACPNGKVYCSNTETCIDDIKLSCASNGAKWYVNPAGDQGTYKSIQDAVNEASSCDTIYIALSIYYENVVINKSLKIVGTDATNTIVDGNGRGPVFDIRTPVIQSPIDVAISGLTIRNGTAPNVGGGIYNSGGHLTIACCNISGNTGPNAGGIFNSGGIATVSNCIISKNRAIPYGYGGGILSGSNDLSKMTVVNSTIADNYAYYGGGGIYTDGPLEVKNSIVSGNRVDRRGGGIFYTWEPTIVGSSITMNIAGDIGGGIFKNTPSWVPIGFDEKQVNGNSPDQIARLG